MCLKCLSASQLVLITIVRKLICHEHIFEIIVMEIVKLEKCTTLYKLGVNINYIYTSVLILKSDSKICLILLALIILVSFSLYIMVVVTVPYYVDG